MRRQPSHTSVRQRQRPAILGKGQISLGGGVSAEEGVLQQSLF